jgi:hypothetical protein
MAYSTLDWNDPLVTQGEMDIADLSLARVPAGPAGRYSLMGGNATMFSPNSTPEQVDACIKWLEVTGFSPNANDTTRQGLEEKYDNTLAKNMPVGPAGNSVWQSGEAAAMEKEIRDSKINVNMALWNDFCDGKDVIIHPEVPMNAQELYKALDNVIQSVLTDENADVKALMTAANQSFQTDYLDNIQ